MKEEELEDCPHCCNEGVLVEETWFNPNIQDVDYKEVQCEWCWTNPNSRFLYEEKQRKLKEELDRYARSIK